MPLSERENYLRNASMTGPEWMPCSVSISGASWDQWRGELEQVLARHPTLFPGFEPGERDYDEWDYGAAHRAGERFTDAWGCVWYSEIAGIEGQVEGHPLADWDKLETYRAPDPLVQWDREPANWEKARSDAEQARREERLVTGGVRHGFLLMRMWYLRGFENLMFDIATDDPRLPRLIELLAEHNRRLIGAWLDIGVDVMGFGEDLGTQTASIISPRAFAGYVAPVYKRLIKPCRDAGCHVAFHSDGYVMELLGQLIDCGVTIVNPQDLCNGIDNLVREVKGRACIRLDIDRQKIVPFGTRREIRDLIEEEVRKLGSPAGGLELLVGIYPPTPPENVDALCDAMEEFRTYWWDGRG
ncbi:MAG TPA: uroporphyrinogen decarboxylase family protein [Armatimonadota bacterium]|nr:uroporphyrinogen decarboxylase family protein [Armatimonadota bacterium]